jgi:hypothetical protein
MTTLIGDRCKSCEGFSQVVLITRKLPFFIFLNKTVTHIQNAIRRNAYSIAIVLFLMFVFFPLTRFYLSSQFYSSSSFQIKNNTSQRKSKAVGGYIEKALPLPIPNRVVKLLRANGTDPLRSGE